MKILKKIGLALSLMLVLVPCLNVQAKDITDNPDVGDITILPEEDLTKVPDNGLGSISVELTDPYDKYLSKENVKFGVVKIADIEKGEYILKESFADEDLDLNGIKTADEIDKVAKDLAKKVETPDHEMTTDEEGKATCKDLPVGVYLVYVEDLSDFETITPFIVGIPTWDDEDELFQYDVTVYPKHTALPRILVNKVDSVTGQNIKSNKFEFTSYAQENCADSSKIEEIAGNPETGTAEFLIRYGTTYIKESSAPKGYKLSDEVIKVEFTDKGLFVNGKEVKVDDDHRYSIVYQNILLPSVNTGTSKNKDMMYMMLGVVVIALGASIATVRKIRKCEE
ncbi:SpaA isopeptide-forming pilin-related protein [Holdemanella biformis]|uniref:SpaA-like prealbumin fold domain-containing protein n=1 Tax=Holdemanella biformis TaxID=1735 RepID=A0A413UBJ8_9FIRM|nr:SpaA isopeptide-forming pilin-related protein [Holdemanella biformis]RHB03683.1 hypothetical protein DW907_08285 [Holdemanella biformis]